MMIPPDPNALCKCGLDTSTDGFRQDIVCPKHDGICRVVVRRVAQKLAVSAGNSEESRIAFEAWFGAPVPLKRNAHGGYIYMAAYSAWQAWSAAWDAAVRV